MREVREAWPHKYAPANGNLVVFDDYGSYIENKETGERTLMTQVGGMYFLKMWGLT